ncbi:o-succinylbenzoate synthase [Corynebacterium sp. TAE3-ERU12]|uniref:o-succinylbenzoate synthase n=1 Tax=Corynebacterium sp. TAE3-ERU12 TaxID=2849491 RepID=UPI001C43E275|nr:o-succinylbenzoate synthase [Corynebacterium sp. TAE3-ERU12]MBV7294567.1 o-succinylbenzoate synthase [Corynebacterium sp. TAE3-ERU12]
MHPAEVATFLDCAHVVALPMRTKFRGITTRELLLVEGEHGWAEFGAFPEYQPPEAANWLRSCVSIWRGDLPTPRHRWVPINATVPDIPADNVADILNRYPGASVAKVKVAGDSTLEQDIARVAAVRAACPNMQVRCDANGGWTVEEAMTALRELTADGALDYIEQPCPSVAELAEVRRRCRAEELPVRIAADESIRRAADPWEVVRADAADVAVLKAAPMGGPKAFLDLAGQLAEHGLDVTVSSALDSAVGMYAGLITAASLPDPAPAGLATGALFEHDVCPPRRIVDGQLEVCPLEPDRDALVEFAAPESRRRWWCERVEACAEVLRRQ